MEAPTEAFETAAVKRIAWRILPLVVLAYCVAYIDRSNIAVAAPTMNKDLGFSPFIYGLGAGIFFLGCVIFEIPSDVILARVGARRWIARIMFAEFEQRQLETIRDDVDRAQTERTDPTARADITASRSRQSGKDRPRPRGKGIRQ
jgi:Major Facilitator Superfamily